MNEANPILKECVRVLSVVLNVSTGLAHPLDEARAKELFIALREKGIAIDSNEIYSSALENSWPERHARALSELADKIASGARVQIKHPRDWGEPTLEKIIQDISAS